jgi:hypothetical protein
LCLDSEVNLVQWSENFVNLANLCLVFNEDRSVEVWDLRVDRFANNFAFTCVHETSHSCEFNCIRLASVYEKVIDVVRVALTNNFIRGSLLETTSKTAYDAKG